MRPGVLVSLALFSTGCPTVDQGDPPVTPDTCHPDFLAFQTAGGVWDSAITPADTTKSCIQEGGCHRQEDGRSALRLVAKDRASLTPSEWQQNYDIITRFLNCFTPEASPFVTKPKTGEDPHGGGDLWTCDGTAEPCTMVEQWISGG